MYVSIPSGDCRTAIGKAILAGERQIELDKIKFSEQAFAALHGGAIHNGMKVDAAREQEMRDMVARDVEHMLERHPVHETLKVLLLLNRMLERNCDTFVTIDDADFSMLEDYLPYIEVEV